MQENKPWSQKTLEERRSYQRAATAKSRTKAALARVPERMAKDLSQGRLDTHAQQEAADQVYHQRPAGKGGTGAPLDEALQSVACQRSRDAKHDQQSNPHGPFLFPRFAS